MTRKNKSTGINTSSSVMTGDAVSLKINSLNLLKSNFTKQKINRILLTNDDGYDAKGLQVLLKIAHEIAHEVWVVAPSSDQSGQSQSITLHQPLHCEKYQERYYHINGTPSDCVIFTLKNLMRDYPPQLVLSGVNRGANVADSVSFSGTIGATLTSAILGVPAIALSQSFRNADAINWPMTEKLASSVIHHLIADAFSIDGFDSENLSIDFCYNINFPDEVIEDISGFAFAKQGRGSIHDINIETYTTPRNKECHWYAFEHNYSVVKEPLSDINILRNKAIAISTVNVCRHSLN